MRRSILALAIALVALIATSSVALANTGQFRITTVAAQGGQPIAGASVTLAGPTQATGTTNASGQVTLTGLTPGYYTITASLPGASGTAFANVVQFQDTNVTMALAPAGTAPGSWPPVTATAFTTLQSAGGGVLGNPSTYVVLTNRSSAAATNVTLHVTGPSGSALQDCYAGGGPGTNPCNKLGNYNEALWLVGTLNPGQTSAVYHVDWLFGTASAGAIGTPDQVWYSWGGPTTPGQYVVSLAPAGPLPPDPAPAPAPAPTPIPAVTSGEGSLVVIPVNDDNGVPISGAPVQIAGAQLSTGGTTTSAGITFTGIPASTYAITAGGQTVNVAVPAGQTTTVRMGSFATLTINLVAWTVSSSSPGSSATTYAQLSNVSTIGAAQNIAMTTQGPNSTSFVSCNPGTCARAQITNGTGVAWSIGGLAQGGSTGIYGATFAGGGASAGNLGPNQVIVTYLAPSGQTGNLNVQLDQALGN